MPESAYLAIPLLPLLAAALIGLGLMSGRLVGERTERLTASTMTIAVLLSALLLLAAAVDHHRSGHALQTNIGTWIASGRLRIAISLTLDTLSLGWCALVVLLGLLAARFSVAYLHREPGFHRYFMLLGLFVGSMLLLGVAGNGALAFVGWELSGVSSYLLIAYAYDRPNAAAGATVAFVTNRFGDVCFILALLLTLSWMGDLEWPTLNGGTIRLDTLHCSVLAVLFAAAAAIKSAQVPATFWVTRAIEGPTPSSAVFYGAVMIHAGVFLLLRVRPLLEAAPGIMLLVAAIGALTAIYGFVCGLVQNDAKSALMFSTIGQLGLMFLSCGLGWWTLAAFHLGAHASVRLYQFLSAPSFRQHGAGLRMRAPPAPLRDHAPWFGAAVHRFWLESLCERSIALPVRQLAAEFERFEREIVEPAIGYPSVAGASIESLADWEARRSRGGPARDGGRSTIGIGGLIAHRLAAGAYWFEDRLILRGFGTELWQAARQIGHRMGRIESLLLRPRYLVLLVLLSLLSVA